jgi:hypothetical protein
MATSSDWTDRLGRVTEQYNVTLPGLITNYEMKTRALNDLVKQSEKLEDDLGKLEHEGKQAEQEASTADREFIETRKTLPDPWKPSKIYTVQDFTFYLFFVSYFIFLVAVSMVAQRKMMVFVGGIFVLFFIIAIFYRYI